LAYGGVNKQEAIIIMGSILMRGRNKCECQFGCSKGGTATKEHEERKEKAHKKEVEGAKTKQSKFVWWMQTEQSMLKLVSVCCCVNNGRVYTAAVTTTRTKAKREQKDQTHKSSVVKW
jgi:hypothetical protein